MTRFYTLAVNGLNRIDAAHPPQWRMLPSRGGGLDIEEGLRNTAGLVACEGMRRGLMAFLSLEMTRVGRGVRSVGIVEGENVVKVWRKRFVEKARRRSLTDFCCGYGAVECDRRPSEL